MAKELPRLEEGAYLLGRAGGAALGKAVPSAAPPVEGGVHVLDELAQVAAALDNGVPVVAVLSGKHGAAPAGGLGDGVAQPPRTITGSSA